MQISTEAILDEMNAPPTITVTTTEDVYEYRLFEIEEAYYVQRADIPVFFISALGSDEDIQRGYDSGCTRYFVKPLNMQQLMDEIRESLSSAIAGRGIDIIDVRIKRVDLPPDVSQRVFDRMAATRNQQAEQIRAEGDERAKLVRAEADREKTVLLAEARREAEQIRGEGDAQRNEIYAVAYEQDAEFFRFQRALIACEKAFGVGDIGDSADTESSGPRTQQEPTRIVVGPNQLGLCDEFIERARANGTARR